MLLTRSKEADYAELCQLDVLGLGEQKSNKKRQNISRIEGPTLVGWYEISLFWKTNRVTN